MKFYWLVTEKTQVTDGRKEGRTEGRKDGRTDNAISISPSLFHRRGIKMSRIVFFNSAIPLTQNVVLKIYLVFLCVQYVEISVYQGEVNIFQKHIQQAYWSLQPSIVEPVTAQAATGIMEDHILVGKQTVGKNLTTLHAIVRKISQHFRNTACFLSNNLNFYLKSMTCHAQVV